VTPASSPSTVRCVTTVAHEAGRRAVGPRLPTWKAALSAAIGGWLVALVGLGAVGLAASLLGVVGRPAGEELRDWPYPAAGLASVTANAIVWLWILVATALLIRGLLAARFGGRISTVPVACALALTGFAPFLPRGFLDLSWPVALAITAALLRLAPAFSPPPLPRRATAALLAVGALSLAIPVAHGLAHPLRPTLSIRYDPPRRNTATFELRNAGFADVTVTAITLHQGAPLFVLTAVRVDEQPASLLGVSGESAALPSLVKGRSQAFVQLRLRPVGCGTGPPVRASATVRYRVHGSGHAVTVPAELAVPACRG
jgi:hypothetical protein